MSNVPRKVAFCIDAMARGGTELQLAGLIQRLDRAQIAPVLLTIRESPAELAPVDCEILPWQVPRLISPHGLRSCRRLAQWLRHNRVQAVHTFFQDATVFAGSAARWAGVPVRLAGLRDLGFWRTRGQEALLHTVQPMMTGFVANSQVVKDHFCERDGLAPDKVAVVGNGIDIGQFPFVEHRGPVRDVAIVGNLNRPVKRTDLFVRAAGRLKADFPDVTWHVFGEGPLRTGLETLAAQVGVSGRIVFHGRVSDVAGKLEDMQIGVNCSDSEGFSNAVLEYMLMGCAVVATDVGGNSEAISHGRTGLLVPPDDVAGLSQGLAELLADTDKRVRLAAAARKWVAENFAWEKCVARHTELYFGRA